METMGTDQNANQQENEGGGSEHYARGLLPIEN